ncbi:hypothetical protein CDAR_529791 [Caerostris darwini]|uniref:Uncharacterized protein n=1 Tax=Caerostris darwini TaxID=1538125 RepID=A0AAV4SCL7_9ARAC|nr:hypothetical protein CDAR_529791 [Caerostris darwini]
MWDNDTNDACQDSKHKIEYLEGNAFFPTSIEAHQFSSTETYPPLKYTRGGVKWSPRGPLLGYRKGCARVATHKSSSINVLPQLLQKLGAPVYILPMSEVI